MNKKPPNGNGNGNGQESFHFDEPPRRRRYSSLPDSDRVRFDREASRGRKAEGMDMAAENRRKLLGFAREIAEELAEANPAKTCTADEVQKALIAQGIHPTQLGNAAGSLFKNQQWEFCRWMKSQRVSNHARLIGIWKLKESA